MHSKRNRKWHKGGSTRRDGVCPAVGWVSGQGAGPWGRDKERALTLALQGTGTCGMGWAAAAPEPGDGW